MIDFNYKHDVTFR